MTLSPLLLTEAAVAQMHRLMANQPGAYGLKLSLKSRGCSGLAYELSLVTEDPALASKGLIPIPHSPLFLDARALLFVVGTEIDYVEDDLAAHFLFKNPNQKGGCGCGQSFFTQEKKDTSSCRTGSACDADFTDAAQGRNPE